MKIKIYGSYGVLAREKMVVYTWSSPASDIYDVMTVEIPDEIVYGKNYLDELLINLDGQVLLLSECLVAWGDKPALRWHDGQGERRIMLRVDAHVE